MVFRNTCSLWLNMGMNPEQPGAPPSGNPYDFIVNPAKQPKQSKFASGNGSSFALRIAVIVGIAVVVMIIVGVGINLLFGQKTNAAVLVDIAETQSELVRVAAQSDQASDQVVLNAATNTRYSVLTQQKLMLLFLTQHKQKVSPKQLLLKKDLTTDQQLAAAHAASTYDAVFTRIMVGQLQDYSTALSQAFKNATSASERKLLKDDYDQVQLLLKQWPTPIAAAQSANQ